MPPVSIVALLVGVFAALAVVGADEMQNRSFQPNCAGDFGAATSNLSTIAATSKYTGTASAFGATASPTTSSTRGASDSIAFRWLLGR